MSTPIRPLPVLSRAALRTLLASARPGDVHVIVAPPGSGKSTLLRQELAHMISTGSLTNALWATHTMRDAHSLGAEAEDDFKRLGVPVQIVRSHGDPAQFNCAAPHAPRVKIISHARIPQIFGNRTYRDRTLNTTSLLVIDEDPFQSLTIHGDARSDVGRIDIAALACAGSAVGEALSVIDEIVATHGLGRDFKSMQLQVTGEHLTGRVMWGVFAARHPLTVDVPKFTMALEALKVPNAALIARSFAEDDRLARADPAKLSERFGLDWAGDATPGAACLRYDLTVPLTFTQPVLVLDGYANQRHYEALFHGQTVHMHVFDPGAPLHIECSDVLTVESVREGTGHQVQHRRQIAEEVALVVRAGSEKTPPRSTLVITPLVLTIADTEWHQFLSEALAEQGLSMHDVAPGYWMAGRGKNAYTGFDVIALNRPRVNRRFRDHRLTALFPFSAEERERADRYLNSAETLQMLHRGRQTRHAGADRPRVILAQSLVQAQHLLQPHASRVDLVTYTPQLHFTPKSKNARWADALQALARELILLFPNGLALDLLRGLPIHAGSSRRTPDVTRRLHELARLQNPNSHLYRAFHAPAEWKYREVALGGRDNGKEAEKRAMAGCGLTYCKVLKNGTVECNEISRGGGTIVYIPDGADAVIAAAQFREWLATGVLPSPRTSAATTTADPAAEDR